MVHNVDGAYVFAKALEQAIVYPKNTVTARIMESIILNWIGVNLIVEALFYCDLTTVFFLLLCIYVYIYVYIHSLDPYI